jgi:hypothetical protein
MSRPVPQAVALLMLLLLPALPGLGIQLQAGLLLPDQPLVPNPIDVSACLVCSQPELPLVPPPSEAETCTVSTCRASSTGDDEEQAPPLAVLLAELQRPLLVEGGCTSSPVEGPAPSSTLVVLVPAARQPLAPRQVASLADDYASFVLSPALSSLFRPPRLA